MKYAEDEGRVTTLGGKCLQEVHDDRKEEYRTTMIPCDLTMPGMNGWETLAALRKLSPGIL